MLNELLTCDVIELNCECDNWQEAVKTGAILLVKKRCVEKRYGDAIIKNFQELGPYMVIAPGIVLAHARPENGVNELSMSLITLKTPIAFGNATNDPVKLVLTLAAIDNNAHLKMLTELMALLMNDNDIRKICLAVRKEEVLKVLNKYSVCS